MSAPGNMAWNKPYYATISAGAWPAGRSAMGPDMTSEAVREALAPRTWGLARVVQALAPLARGLGRVARALPRVARARASVPTRHQSLARTRPPWARAETAPGRSRRSPRLGAGRSPGRHA